MNVGAGGIASGIARGLAGEFELQEGLQVELQVKLRFRRKKIWCGSLRQGPTWVNAPIIYSKVTLRRKAPTDLVFGSSSLCLQFGLCHSGYQKKQKKKLANPQNYCGLKLSFRDPCAGVP